MAALSQTFGRKYLLSIMKTPSEIEENVGIDVKTAEIKQWIKIKKDIFNPFLECMNVIRLNLKVPGRASYY